jgi:hypothetical protein
MKIDGLKKLIKEAVREAIQDELKDILLEAVRTPKTLVKESYTPIPVPPQPPTQIFTQPASTQPPVNLRAKYADVLGETALSFTTQDIQQPFKPQAVDPVNGNLGAGEVGMDQIMNLLNSK